VQNNIFQVLPRFTIHYFTLAKKNGGRAASFPWHLATLTGAESLFEIIYSLAG